MLTPRHILTSDLPPPYLDHSILYFMTAPDRGTRGRQEACISNLYSYVLQSKILTIRRNFLFYHHLSLGFRIVAQTNSALTPISPSTLHPSFQPLKVSSRIEISPRSAAGSSPPNDTQTAHRL